jgi:hypothetical protein
LAAKVKLTNSATWPMHGILINGTPETQAANFEKCRNLDVVIGKPEEPLPGAWNCGTDVVFPVLEFRGVRYAGKEFLCRHQIEAGD